MEQPASLCPGPWVSRTHTDHALRSLGKQRKARDQSGESGAAAELVRVEARRAGTGQGSVWCSDHARVRVSRTETAEVNSPSFSKGKSLFRRRQPATVETKRAVKARSWVPAPISLLNGGVGSFSGSTV